MFVKNLNACDEFTANDGCLIREILHPKNDPVDLDWSMAMARVLTGKHTLPHKLIQAEVYYILSGLGRMYINNESRAVSTGDVISIPPQSVQWIENTGNDELRFIAIVSPPWREQDDQLCESDLN
jgi:mannose-6-phosphate isomerase-like protein (cupin superfamily)